LRADGAERALSDHKIDLAPEEVQEILGGVAALYLEALLIKGDANIKTQTRRVFVSDYASGERIFSEIENCSGLTKNECNAVLTAMEDVLKSFFKKFEAAESGKPVRFPPFGDLEALEVDASAYLLTYTDPARDLYSRFLLVK
jgi:hypothetical protein